MSIQIIFFFIPDSPPISICFKFFASSMHTVNLPVFGTYRIEKHISPRPTV